MLQTETRKRMLSKNYPASKKAFYTFLHSLNNFSDEELKQIEKALDWNWIHCNLKSRRSLIYAEMSYWLDVAQGKA